jgi:hypothetical protein
MTKAAPMLAHRAAFLLSPTRTARHKENNSMASKSKSAAAAKAELKELAGKTLSFHRYANYFPLMDGKEFKEFAADIKKNGLLEPIDRLDGQILEGRNRYRACLKMLVVPRFVEYTGNDPLGYVISKNLRRRHLKSKERRELIAKLFKEHPELSANQAAKLVGASPTTAGDVRKKLEESGDVSKLETLKDTKGRTQLRRRPRARRSSSPPVDTPAEHEAQLAVLRRALGDPEQHDQQHDQEQPAPTEPPAQESKPNGKDGEPKASEHEPVEAPNPALVSTALEGASALRVDTQPENDSTHAALPESSGPQPSVSGVAFPELPECMDRRLAEPDPDRVPEPPVPESKSEAAPAGDTGDKPAAVTEPTNGTPVANLVSASTMAVDATLSTDTKKPGMVETIVRFIELTAGSDRGSRRSLLWSGDRAILFEVCEAARNGAFAAGDLRSMSRVLDVLANIVHEDEKNVPVRAAKEQEEGE